MFEDLKKVISLFKYWDVHPDISQFEWRFKIQKFARIAEVLGFPLSYSFSIYLKGPYSCELTRDYYSHEDAVRTCASDYVLSPSEVKIAQKLKPYLTTDLQGLEAISTLVHLKQNLPELTDDEFFITIKNLKPYLSDSTVVIARNEVKKLLFDPSFLTPEIQQEIADWDQFDD